MRETQHRKERLNLGKDRAVSAPLATANRMWIRRIFKDGSFLQDGSVFSALRQLSDYQVIALFFVFLLSQSIPRLFG